MRTELLADVHAPAAARRIVETALGDLLVGADDATPGPRPEDVVLVASELVTNAVRAGASRIGVELTAVGECLELGVTDDATGWPTTRHPSWDETGGRGLAIVEKVADEWTTMTLATGKRVTATWSLVDRPAT